MKKKLAGLLMFSQAESLAARGTPEWSAETVGAQSVKWRIYENNYKQKMCGEDLFLVNPKTDRKVINLMSTSIADAEKESGIKMKHEAYCFSKEKYEIAVNCQTQNNCGDPSTIGRAVSKNGIIVATACEQLKQDKQFNRDVFDYHFRTPKPCSSGM